MFTPSISRRSTGSSVPCSEVPCRLCPCRFQAFRLFSWEYNIDQGLLISFNLFYTLFPTFFSSCTIIIYAGLFGSFFCPSMFHQGLPCFPHAVPHTSPEAIYARSRLGRRWCQIRPPDWRSETHIQWVQGLWECVVQHNYGVRLYSVRLGHEENLTKGRWLTGMFPAA